MNSDCYEIKPVAYIKTDFPDKFGIPRQSTLVPELKGLIEFEPEYRDRAAIRGLEEYSHIWLIWGFSKSETGKTSLTCYPPRLGGKVKRGVFAARSPYRPNGLGLSCVKLEEIRFDDSWHPSLLVSGVDMLDGTPVYDIKPYMPYSDSPAEAAGGFGQAHKDDGIKVDFDQSLLEKLEPEVRDAAVHILEQDPRAAYNKTPDYVFGLKFAGYDIRFVADDELIRVIDVVRPDEKFEKIK